MAKPPQTTPPPSVGTRWSRVVWWYLVFTVCYVWFKACYRLRVVGTGNIPKAGPVLLLSNHESYLDPIILGLGSRSRPFYSLARATLFRNRFFAWLIYSLNAVPLDQEQADLSAMRQAVGLLRESKALMIFPEGARTLNGHIQPFEKGTMVLIKRAKPVIVPVAIHGAFDVWRRGQAKPKLWGRIAVAFGRPIQAEQVLAMGADAGLVYLRETVETMRREIGSNGVKAPQAR